jgi:hypothetical protein
MQLISELVAQARKTPVRVLRGQARWAAHELRENPFEVQVTLENVGIEPFQLTHPSDASQPALTVFFHPPNGFEQLGYVRLGAADVVEPVPAATGPAVVLAPGERLTFKARGRVPVVAGEYRAELVYESWVDHGEVAAMQRRLELELGPVTIRPGAAVETDDPLDPLPPIPPGALLPPLPQPH